MIFGAHKPKGHSSLVPTAPPPKATVAAVLPGSASRPDTSSNASIMQRKAQRQAFLSGSKTQVTQSRVSEDSSSTAAAADGGQAEEGSGVTSAGSEGILGVKLFDSPQKQEAVIKRSIDRSLSPSSGAESSVKTEDENAPSEEASTSGPQKAAGKAGQPAPLQGMKPLAKSPRANA